MERTRLELRAGPHRVAALVALPAQLAASRPLVVALHGGMHNAQYFDLPGRSFLDLAAAHGYPALALDRPGYGESSALPPAESTFEQVVAVLVPAIAQALAALTPTGPGVVLVGHSIGGMLAGMIAAGDRDFPVIGISSHGHGTRFIPETEEIFSALAEDPGSEVINPPIEARAQFFMGRPGTYDPALLDLTADVFEAMTKAEMVDALGSPARLRKTAPLIRVPVQYVLGLDENLWTATAECVAEYRDLHSASPFVDARLMPNVGHNIDMHHLGPAHHLRQLAFIAECAAWAARGL